ncbi:unnamed protein product [Pieris macdunnoughi]|uniref:Uncharacterized protein n=1 Tax=Pieris macdunnoughi TaxID=345717 RepID=A0A821VE13_9NEOP|nr:unnamed protein product [Pieris macdunnoughi]
MFLIENRSKDLLTDDVRCTHGSKLEEDRHVRYCGRARLYTAAARPTTAPPASKRLLYAARAARRNLQTPDRHTCALLR